jgi:hypothetical protein
MRLPSVLVAAEEVEDAVPLVPYDAVVEAGVPDRIRVS